VERGGTKSSFQPEQSLRLKQPLAPQKILFSGESISKTPTKKLHSLQCWRLELAMTRSSSIHMKNQNQLAHPSNLRSWGSPDTIFSGPHMLRAMVLAAMAAGSLGMAAIVNDPPAAANSSQSATAMDVNSVLQSIAADDSQKQANSPLGPAKVMEEKAAAATIQTYSQLQKLGSEPAPAIAGGLATMELRSGKFAIQAGMSAGFKSKAAALGRSDGSIYAFVVCKAPVQAPLAETLKAAGAEIIGQYPPNTYIVRARAASVDGLAANTWVHGLVEPAVEHKLHAKLKQAIAAGAAPDEMVEVAVALFVDDAHGNVRQELERLGLSIKDYIGSITTVNGLAKRSALSGLAAHNEVLFIEPILPNETCLSTSVGFSDATYVRSDGGHFGANVTVGIIDSGFQFNHDAFMGQSGYPVMYGLGWNVSGDGDNSATWTDYNGHGSHVLGIMMSRWGGHSPRLDGMDPWLAGDGAHAVRCVRCGKNDGSSSIYNADSAISTLTSDNAALVINNSWGSADNTGNNSSSRAADASTWNNGQLWVFAAGNSGTAAGSIGSPGAAKNVLAVGNLRNLSTLDVAYDSSMGPTSDSRFKPEIYAPGASVESVDAHNLSGSTWKWGTSMATPHVTAAAAALMDHYTGFQRHPAMTKAYLVAAARRLSTLPSTRAGILDAYRSHWSTGDSEGHWGSYDADIGNHGTVYWDINIPAGYDKMYVALCWTEPAASAGASYQVLNDIDLRVDYNADGSDEWASAGVRDNYEFVEINAPAGGLYRFKAYGYNVTGSSRLGLGVVMRKNSACAPVVSGVIKNGSGIGISGVTVSLNNGGGSTTTDSGGNYSLTVPCGWSGTATPSKATYSFSPASTAYGSLLGNDATGNYTGNVNVTALANNSPVTYSDEPRVFSFAVNGFDWCAVGIAPSTDHDIKADTDPAFPAPYSYSTFSGTVRDFIVVNGHNAGSGTHYAQVYYGAPSTYTIEGEWDIPDLALDSGYPTSIGSSEVLNAYEALLPAGHQFQCAVDVSSGTADLGVYLFKPSQTYGSRGSATWRANSAGAGGSEAVVFTTDTTAEYGIVVVNENGGSANYTITVRTPPAPTLSAPVASGGSVNFQMTGPAGAIYIIQTSTDLVNWTSLGTVTMPPSGILPLSYPIVTSETARFYRALLQ
jgi:subtilisin family serine protease